MHEKPSRLARFIGGISVQIFHFSPWRISIIKLHLKPVLAEKAFGVLSNWEKKKKEKISVSQNEQVNKIPQHWLVSSPGPLTPTITLKDMNESGIWKVVELWQGYRVTQLLCS